MTLDIMRPMTPNTPANYSEPERHERRSHVNAGPDGCKAEQKNAEPRDTEGPHTGAIVPREESDRG